METLNNITQQFTDFAWGTPLLVLLMGGGLFFFLYSGLLPFRYIRHAIQILRGKYDDPNAPGDINHFQALTTALAATVGMGNISGVAVAIATGGPGALFWMWMSAIVGMATKFFTCTLAIMYRGKDSKGDLQGGPMYVIMEGLGKKWKPLAVFFSVVGLIGALPLFSANQLTKALTEVGMGSETSPGFMREFVKELSLNFSWVQEDNLNILPDIGIGLLVTVLVITVIFGGIKRIAAVASKLVPTMVVLYALTVLYILISYASLIPESFLLIFEDAFTGKAVVGGLLGEVIRQGVKRAAFSNEAGVGTAPMAHGAAKTKEPVREGLIAMLGPAIDTLIVCTMTALTIIVTGAWKTGDASQGIPMTLRAFETAMPGIGTYILMVCVLVFAISSLFTFSYYGTKCLGFLIGAEYKHYYNYVYILAVFFGAVVDIEAVMNIIDGAYAFMAVPTMVSALILAPKVKAEAKAYFQRLKTG